MPRIMRMGANGGSLRRRARTTSERAGGGGALREQGGVTPPFRESHSAHRAGAGEAWGCRTAAYSSGRGLSLVSGSRGRTKMPSKSTKLTAMPAVRKPSRLPPRLLVI